MRRCPDCKLLLERSSEYDIDILVCPSCKYEETDADYSENITEEPYEERDSEDEYDGEAD